MHVSRCCKSDTGIRLHAFADRTRRKVNSPSGYRRERSVDARKLILASDIAEQISGIRINGYWRRHKSRSFSAWQFFDVDRCIEGIHTKATIHVASVKAAERAGIAINGVHFTRGELYIASTELYVSVYKPRYVVAPSSQRFYLA